jgi:hypothetical protein
MGTAREGRTRRRLREFGQRPHMRVAAAVLALRTFPSLKKVPARASSRTFFSPRFWWQFCFLELLRRGRVEGPRHRGGSSLPPFSSKRTFPSPRKRKRAEGSPRLRKWVHNLLELSPIFGDGLIDQAATVAG